MTAEERLAALADEKNADFLSRLVPNVAREKMLGVRAPALRALAKELYGSAEGEDFLRRTPHAMLDENNLHAALLSLEKDYARCLRELDAFLPFVDNWASCDMLRPAAVKRHLGEFEKRIDGYLSSAHPYTQRFGIEMLMCHYLDEHFDSAQLARVAAIRSEEYYVRMMQAWYFATALAKQYDSAVGYLESRALDSWTHRKTIQKAIESYRIGDAKKAYLKSLK